MSEYLLVVPTYNEAENIKQFIENVIKLELDVLFVDGSSPDNTSIIIQEYQKKNSQIFLINQTSKLGLGEAYREGFQWALEKRYEYMIEMDADFSHRFEDLQKLIHNAKKNTLVIGSRYVDGGSIVGWKKRRKYLSIFANKITKFIKKSNINDLTSGFRIFHKDILENINFLNTYSDGYSFQIEMALLTEKNYQVIEVPIIFLERSTGKSKMNLNIIIEAIIFSFKRQKK